MKKYNLILLLLLGVVTVNAQSEIEGRSTKPGRSTTFVNNSFWDNWFIGAGANANVYFGDQDADASFFNRVTVAPTIQFGKWISPYFGMRVRGSGLTNLHTFHNNATQMGRNKFVTTDLTFMWNMTDYLMNYSSTRVYNFIPFVGAGWAFGYDYNNFPEGKRDHVHSATVDVGIINRFRLSERVALDIEMSGKLLRDEFDLRTNSKHRYDMLGSVSASLVMTVGKRATFSEAVLRDQNEIDMLNNRINDQRAEIERLANRPTPEPTVVVKEVVRNNVVEKGNEPINNVVLFKIGSSKIDPYQGVNIYNVSQYLKNNPDMKVRIVGYTDKETGTPAINERLSRERAQNVADVMTGKHGISKDRITVDWKGQTAPPFDVKEWNRAVIMYLDEIE